MMEGALNSQPTWDKWKRRLGALSRWLLVLGVVSGAVYWFRFSPVAVLEHSVQSSEMVYEVMGTGTLEARVKSTISPKISGRIEKLLVDQGDRVQAGQLLVRLDDADLKQQVGIAQANLAAAQAALDRLQADDDRAAAVLEQARQSYERVKKLVAQKVATADEHDKAIEALRVAEAGQARARAALEEGRKQLVAAEKNLSYRQALLADAEVRAPYAGLVVRRFRDPGDIVVPGSPMLTLVSLEEIWVSAWVDESEIARLRVGQPARVVFRSEPDRSYEGQVARLGRETDRETREFLVDVRVLRLPTIWAVGQRAEVYIQTERRSAALVLPGEFVVWRDGQSGVYMKAGGRAEWRPVVLGLQSGEQVQVLSGLVAGDIVLLAARGAKIPLDGRRITAP